MHSFKKLNFKKKHLISFFIMIFILISFKAASTNDCKFKSEKLGLSLSFPEHWRDKYSVIEKDRSIYVYFKPKDKLSHTGGLFFTIIQKNDDLNEEMYDTIYGLEKYYKVNEITYFIGGPLDVNFPENHPEFNEFLKMTKEVPEILSTLAENNR